MRYLAELRLEGTPELYEVYDLIMEHGDMASDAFWRWLNMATIHEIVTWANTRTAWRDTQR